MMTEAALILTEVSRMMAQNASENFPVTAAAIIVVAVGGYVIHKTITILTEL